MEFSASDFFDSIANKTADKTEITRALDKKFLVEKNEEGYTPYLWAAVHGNVECVQLLKQTGDPNAVSQDMGENVLHLAARFGHENLVKYILTRMKTVDPLARNKEDLTAIHLAAREGKTNVIKELIKNGVDINLVSYMQKLTPLHIAARANNPVMVRCLLYFSADIEMKNNEGLTPYEMATDEETKQYLINPMPFNDTPQYFDEAVALMIKKSLDFKVFVIEHRDVLKYRRNDGFTLLHLACRDNLESIVKFLISAKAPITPRIAIDGKTPLHLAAWNHNDAIIDLFPPEAKEEMDKTRESPKQLYERTKEMDDQKNKFYSMVNFIVNRSKENEALALKAIKRKNTPYIAREDGFTLLHYAAMTNYMEILVALLGRKDTRVNAATNDGTTAIMIAVMLGHTNIVNKLIEKKADVNAKKTNGTTAIQFAVANNKMDMVELLIANGADVHVTNTENGATVLHHAAMAVKPDLFIRLLPEYNDINIKCADGTPLHFASKMGRIETINYLFENGADHNLTDDYDNTPLHIAAKEGKLEALKILVPHYELGKKGNEGNNILHLAVKSGSIDIVNYIFTLEGHKELECENELFETPIIIAIKKKDHVICTLLLSNGTDPNTPLEDGTILHYAIKNNLDKVVESIVQGGADVGLQNSIGITPIILAINSRYFDCCKILIKKGVKIAPYIHQKLSEGLDIEVLKQLIICGLDLNETDEDGNTLLMIALKANLEPFIDLLLEKHADPNIANDDAEIPLGLAYDSHNVTLIKKLLYHGANPDVPIHKGECLIQIASSKQNFGIFEYLRNVKFDVNIRGNHGNTPLHFAVVSTHSKKTTDHRDLMVKKLIKYGGDPNIQNDQGMTPLHFASGLTKIETLKALASLPNIDPTITNKLQRNPLQTAVEAGKKENVQYLGEMFPNLLESVDKYGMTPLQFAVSTNKKECSVNLLKLGAKPGNTIFELASHPEHEKLFEGLIPYLDIRSVNEQGKTPLEVGIEANNIEFVKALVDFSNTSKKNINNPMSDDKMPSEFAEDRGFNEIFDYLERKLVTYPEEIPKEEEDEDKAEQYSHHDSSKEEEESNKENINEEENQNEPNEEEDQKPTKVRSVPPIDNRPDEEFLITEQLGTTDAHNEPAPEEFLRTEQLESPKSNESSDSLNFSDDD